MTSYLDAYGAAEERRAQLHRRVLLSAGVAVTVAIAALVAYYSFRTRGQERVVSQFLGDIKQQKYQDAYRMWCPENCRLYPPEEFLKDWGPAGEFAKNTDWKVEHVDYCDGGVVFDLNLPDDMGLWVNRSTGVISFNPTARCPGRHLRLGAFFKSLFS